MPVQSFYGDQTRNVGAPIAGQFLAEFFATRKGMNDAARADAEGGENPADLGKMELAARESLGKLASALADARSGDTRSYNDLMKTIIQSKTAITTTNTQVQGDLAEQRLRVEMEFKNAADKEAETLSKAIAIPDDAAAILSNLGYGHDVTADSMRGQIESQAQVLRAGGKGDPKYDEIVRQGYNALKASKGEAFARQVAQSLGYEKDPNAFFLEKHSPLTYDEATKRAQEVNRRYGAGASAGLVDTWVSELGANPRDATGRSTSTSARTSGPVTTGAGSGPRTGGAVSVQGLSPEAMQAFASGDDPYAALQAAIKAQAAYADSLANRRADASKHRASLYPMANPYTTTPNTYVSERGQRAAHAVGEMDPMIAEQWATGLSHNGGNIAKAYEEVGPIDGQFTPHRFAPEEMEAGGDLGEYLATADNPVDILMHQPAEVQALFQEAWFTSKNDPKRGAELYREVTPDAVRAAYGQALQRAEHDPAEVARLHTALSALPDQAAGPWRDHFNDLLDTYSAHRMTGGSQANSYLTGSLGNLGRALEQSGATHTARRERNYRESRDSMRYNEDAADEIEGRRLGQEAWARGPEAALAAWSTADKYASSPMTRAALKAIRDANATTPQVVGGRSTHKIDVLVEGEGAREPIGVVRTPSLDDSPTSVEPEDKGAMPIDALAEVPDFGDADAFEAKPPTEPSPDWSDIDAFEAPPSGVARLTAASPKGYSTATAIDWGDIDSFEKPKEK